MVKYVVINDVNMFYDFLQKKFIKKFNKNCLADKDNIKVFIGKDSCSILKVNNEVKDIIFIKE